MSPIQQMLLGVGGVVDTKPYIDDVFSTFLYTGTGTAQTINNGIDLAGEGGLVWTKVRNQSWNNALIDTVRGGSKILRSNLSNAESNYSNLITSFNNNGYTLGSDPSTGTVNYSSSENYASWTFRKAPGFFDVVTYTGNNSSNRAISHSLESAPGLILIKALNATKEWQVWHRDQHGKVGVLDTNAAFFSNASRFPTIPTSTNFYVGNDSALNDGSTNYVAYIFAGGESTAATARSVDFDGSTDALQLASNADLAPNTGDFTFECWLKTDAWVSNWQTIYHNGVVNGLFIGKDNSDNFVVRASNNTSFIEQSTLPSVGQWTHIAVTRSGSTLRLFYNGLLKNSVSNSHNFLTAATGIAATAPSSGEAYGGEISNLRFVKGTALYTSSFRPPTEPLTNITNTKLLCCNNSSTTGSTVTPETITANSSPTASTDSPFDDPAGFAFGENEDQNVIKCGSYVGNASTDGPEINLGWEPQWLLYKSAEGTDNWEIIDMMRGQFFDSSSKFLRANTSGAEFSDNPVAPLSTGFKVKNSGGSNNDNNKTYIYMALRRSDGYVGKPRTATELFAMDTGNGSNTIPAFDSGFPVDFGIKKAPASTGDWIATTRLTGLKYVKTNTTGAEGTSTTFVYDSNVGYAKSQDSTDQGWMWKRHAGFDVVLWDGTGANKISSHSLGKTPEMIWAKARSEGQSWLVYHKGLNGGTNPWSKYVTLDGNGAEANWAAWVEAPTSTQFSIISNWSANNQNYIAMLFASVDGISKVGYYSGDGTSNGSKAITVGFQPRFVIIKSSSYTGGEWQVLDTTRGIDNGLQLNSSNAQSSDDFIDLTSTGFTMKSSHNDVNGSSQEYIYYAHA